MNGARIRDALKRWASRYAAWSILLLRAIYRLGRRPARLLAYNRFLGYVRSLLGDRGGRQKAFIRHYTEFHAKEDESRSGPGSGMDQTKVIREALPAIVRELDVRTLFDLPCGDFFWMRHVDLGVDYLGGDIVEEVVAENQKRYEAPHRRFIRIDMVRDPLPSADLIMCRDCLVHLSNEDVLRALSNMKASGAAYLLTTTFPTRARNDDIVSGDWRPINLEAKPFGFPPPIRLLDEQCPDEGFEDKSMGLWRFSDLPIHPNKVRQA